MSLLAHDLAVLYDGHRGVEIHCHAYDERYAHLTHNLIFALHAVFVVLAQLEVVVEETYRAEPHRCEQHEQHVDVGEVAHQQAGYKYGEDDNDTAHCRCAGLCHLAGEVEVADNLANLHFLQAVYHAAAYEDGKQERDHKGGARAESDVVHQPYAREFRFL